MEEIASVYSGARHAGRATRASDIRKSAGQPGSSDLPAALAVVIHRKRRRKENYGRTEIDSLSRARTDQPRGMTKVPALADTEESDRGKTVTKLRYAPTGEASLIVDYRPAQVQVHGAYVGADWRSRRGERPCGRGGRPICLERLDLIGQVLHAEFGDAARAGVQRTKHGAPHRHIAGAMGGIG